MPAKKAAAPLTGAEEHPLVDDRQMRQLHALLAAWGINGDVTRHDYLSRAVDREITSASELTKVEAARIIHELETDTAPEAHTLSAAMLRKLREEFPDDEIGKLPRSTCKACSDSPRKRCEDHSWVSRCGACGNNHSSATMHIDFVGHADVTARLLRVDPTWTWRPFTPEEINGVAPSLRDGLWIMLTVGGVTRPGFGEGSSGQQRGGDQAKVAIGDALRNAAMRFGVALDLWAKGDREWAHAEKTGAEQMAPDEPAPRESAPPPAPWTGPTVDESLGRLILLANDQGTDLPGITAKFREQHGSLTVDQLATDVPPQALAALVDSILAFIEAHADPVAPLAGDEDV